MLNLHRPSVIVVLPLWRMDDLRLPNSGSSSMAPGMDAGKGKFMQNTIKLWIKGQSFSAYEGNSKKFCITCWVGPGVQLCENLLSDMGHNVDFGTMIGLERVIIHLISLKLSKSTKVWLLYYLLVFNFWGLVEN